MKVLLILVDGMRPDSLPHVPKAMEMMKRTAYTMEATTVVPSVTLPCHMSLFHSVDPARHGTTTNTYAPQVRPIDGLCEALRKGKKKSAFFINWEPLRDLSRPGSLVYSCFCRGNEMGYDRANKIVTDSAIAYLTENETDFAFLYLGLVDDMGHLHGWMSPEYMRAVESSWDHIERIVSALPEDYTVIITADHGGHDRVHGTELPEDMTIPVMILGRDFPVGQTLENVNIKDIAPTVTKLLGVEPEEEWEGSSIL